MFDATIKNPLTKKTVLDHNHTPKRSLLINYHETRLHGNREDYTNLTSTRPHGNCPQGQGFHGKLSGLQKLFLIIFP